MVNTNWPKVVTQVALNVGGNDPSIDPVWTDLTVRLREFECSRGRQYEIDQNQAGEASAVFSDKDEYLNPANAASPYAGGLVPYRQILQQAMWPPVPVGAAVNLIGTTAGYDPGNENTAVGAVPPNLLVFAVAATVSTTNPQQGSRSLTWSVVNGGGTQVAGYPILCIPGTQYTASVYIRQSAANTSVIFVNGLATGSSTTTTGSYVRLTVTFTAAQPVHQVYVGSFTPTNNSTVYCDAWQLETGASASTWSSTGPVVYGVFRGFVERWPSEWAHRGMYGMCKVTCVDPLAVLANTKLHTELANAILALAPKYYWRLGEADGVSAWVDKSGNNGPVLVRTDAPTGVGTTFAGGTQTNIPGDPSGTGVAMSSPSAFPQNASVLQTGSFYTPRSSQPIALGGAPPFGLTAVLVVSRTAVQTVETGRMLTLSTRDFSNRLMEFFATTWPSIGFYTGPASGFSLGIESAADPWADGQPHLLVMTAACDATNFVANGYVDGTNIGTQSIFTSSFSDTDLTQVQIGGLVADFTTGVWAGEVNRGAEGGVYSHAALFDRELTAAEVAVLYQAFRGFPGESSGARVSRYLGYHFNGSYSVETGASVMGVSNLTEGTALLDACQNVAGTENGNFVANSSGTVLFTSRTNRYLNLTADYTLGESENPYEQGIKFDYDPTRIANTVKIQRSGGPTVTVTDTASEKAYFPREFARDVNTLTDDEANDAANWLLAAMKDPHIRVDVVTLNPGANPALWPVALGAAVGDRVTVKRRASSGALTMSIDFFVEKVTHSHAPGKWITTLQLSPASGLTPWILEDATYGLLQSTTVLGY